MSASIEVAVVGAGPYGLATTVHLRRAGVDVHTFGDPMSFWRTMPAGMLLRSNWSASNLVEPSGALSLHAYQEATGDKFGTPIPVEAFTRYGAWVRARGVGDVDPRTVRRLSPDSGSFRLELEDGHRMEARRAVVACGIAPFAWRPPALDGFPRELVSHTSEHTDFGGFRGRRVAVVGGGQSALESAALLRESGAEVDVFISNDVIVWLHGGVVHRCLGPLAPIVYAPTDVGPLWYSRLVAVPGLFGRLPRRLQTRIAGRCVRPASSTWLRPRLRGVALHLNSPIVSVETTTDGIRLELGGRRTHVADHLLLGTGYRIDIERYSFLAPELLASIRRAGGFPILTRGFESSVPGLHFVGAPAAWSFGPTMRFVSGSWYSSRAVARVIGKERGAARHALVGERHPLACRG